MSALAALELTRERQKADIERRKKVAIDKLAARMAATAARTAAAAAAATETATEAAAATE